MKLLGYAGFVLSLAMIGYVSLWMFFIPFTRENSRIRNLFPDEEVAFTTIKWMIIGFVGIYLGDLAKRLIQDNTG